MINIIVGRPGTGKTYSLVRLALKKINKGVDVYSNFFIDINKFQKNKLLKINHGQIYFWEKISDLVKIKKGIILIDECQLYFNSRNWKDLPLSVQYKFQQHRKHGLDIWGAVQNVKRIDTIVRELVNCVFQMYKIGPLFVMNGYDIEDIDKAKRKSLSTKFYFLSKKIASCYDTFQEIDYNKI